MEVFEWSPLDTHSYTLAGGGRADAQKIWPALCREMLCDYYLVPVRICLLTRRNHKEYLFALPETPF